MTLWSIHCYSDWSHKNLDLAEEINATITVGITRVIVEDGVVSNSGTAIKVTKVHCSLLVCLTLGVYYSNVTTS